MRMEPGAQLALGIESLIWHAGMLDLRTCFVLIYLVDI